MTIPIQDILNKTIGAKKEEREIKHWHPSKIGSCMRGVYLERLGVKPDEEFDERTLRVFDVGHIFEDWIINILKKDDSLKIETQVRVEDAELDISGYADALIEYNGEKKLYEIKSKHSRAFHYMQKMGEGANRHHEYQLWLYMKILNIENGAILYVSKDDLCLLEYPVLLSDKKLEVETMSYIKALNEAWQKKDPSILPLPKKGAWQEKYCRFHKQCLEIK